MEKACYWYGHGGRIKAGVQYATTGDIDLSSFAFATASGGYTANKSFKQATALNASFAAYEAGAKGENLYKDSALAAGGSILGGGWSKLFRLQNSSLDPMLNDSNALLTANKEILKKQELAPFILTNTAESGTSELFNYEADKILEDYKVIYDEKTNSQNNE